MELTNLKKRNVVLVVDDDHRVLESLLLLLSAYGYNVVTADSAEGALVKMQSVAPDIVLTDVRMPGMTGIELAGEIHDLDPEMPVIFMTAYAELELVIDAVRQGVFDFIMKPFNPDYLARAVGRARKFCEMKDQKITNSCLRRRLITKRGNCCTSAWR